jgi:hypothetical protein
MEFLRKTKYWYLFSRKAWISLGTGWLVVLIGLTTYLRMDQAGALLICGAIVAEVFHEKKHRLFVHQVQPGISTTYIYQEVEMRDGEKIHQGIEITPYQNRSGKTTVNADDWTLYRLANENEFSEFEGSRSWDLNRTMKRLESRVDWAIVISAIAGTILWAFVG